MSKYEGHSSHHHKKCHRKNVCIDQVAYKYTPSDPTIGPSDALLIGSESQMSSELSLSGVNLPSPGLAPFIINNDNGSVTVSLGQVGFHTLNSLYYTPFIEIQKGFGPSIQAHYEYSAPNDNSFLYYAFPDAELPYSLYGFYKFVSFPFFDGQVYGDSGFYIGAYPDSFFSKEVQILDSYLMASYPDGINMSIYAQLTPLVIADRPPAGSTLNCTLDPYKFNKVDIVYESEERINCIGQMTRPASITAFLNGVLVHDKAIPIGNDNYEDPPYLNVDQGFTDNTNLGFQTHSEHPDIHFRSIWIRNRERSLHLPKDSYKLMLRNRQDQYNYHKTSLITVPPSNYGDNPQFSDHVLYTEPGGQGEFFQPAQLDNPNRVTAIDFTYAPSDSIVLYNRGTGGSRFDLVNGVAVSHNKFSSYQLHLEVSLSQPVPANNSEGFLVLSSRMKIQISPNAGKDPTPIGTIYLANGDIIVPEKNVIGASSSYTLDLVYHANNYRGFNYHMSKDKLHWWVPNYDELNTGIEEVYLMVNNIVVHNWSRIRVRDDTSSFNNLKFTNPIDWLSLVWIRPLDNFSFLFTDVPTITIGDDSSATIQASIVENGTGLPDGWSWQYRIVTQDFFDGYDGSIASTVPISGYQDPTFTADGSTEGISGNTLSVTIPIYNSQIQYRIYVAIVDDQQKPITRLIYNTFGYRDDRIFEQGLPYNNLNLKDLVGVAKAEQYVANSANLPPCWPGYVGPLNFLPHCPTTIATPSDKQPPIEQTSELSKMDITELRNMLKNTRKGRPTPKTT